MAIATVDDLVAALEAAQANEQVRLPRTFHGDITNTTFPNLVDGVEIVSGTSSDGVPGATLYDANRTRTAPVFQAYHDATIRGLRVVGPEHDVVPDTPDQPHAAFCELHGPNATIGRCVISGYPRANLEFGSADVETNAVVENTTSTHALMEGLGYGIKLNNGTLTVRDSFLDYCRHKVSGYGRPTCNIHSKRNVYGPFGTSHSFDMHNWTENGGPDDVAGGTITLEDDLFLQTHNLDDGEPQEGIVIRGVPDVGCDIQSCSFAHDGPPVEPGGKGDAWRQGGVDHYTKFDPHVSTETFNYTTGRAAGGSTGRVLALLALLGVGAAIVGHGR